MSSGGERQARQTRAGAENSTITGHGAGLWGQFPSSPVGRRESHGLQGGSLAVASGEFCDCIRRPRSSSWEAGGCSLHYLFFLFINYNSADLCRRRTYRKRSISHLITVPDFAAAFTHLSKVLPLTSAELKKSPCFIKWHQIKLAGFCSRPSNMLPKSSPDAAQAVGNLILLALMKTLSSSSRDCTLRSAYADGSAYFFACPVDLFSYVMIRKASQHSQTSLAYGKYWNLNLISVRIVKSGAIIFCRSWWLRQNSLCPIKNWWC